MMGKQEEMRSHQGDPCIYCGTPHDDVGVGACPGVPMRDGEEIHIGDLVEKPWSIEGINQEYRVKDGGNGRLLVKHRTGSRWYETNEPSVKFHQQWRKVTASPAVRFVMLLVDKSKVRSTNKRPQLVRQAIELAIEAQMEFWIDDLQVLRRHYSYYGENEYRRVIESGNKSALKAVEKYMERRPFFFFDPARVEPEKQRLYEGARFQWDGLSVKVTSIKDEDNLIACHQEYDNDERTWKTRRVFRISRDDLARFTELRQKAMLVSMWVHEQRPLPPAELSFSKEPGVFVCEECAETDSPLHTGYWMKESTELEQYCACGKRLYTKPLRAYRLEALDMVEQMSIEDPHFAKYLSHALPLCNEFDCLGRVVALAERVGILGERNG